MPCALKKILVNLCCSNSLQINYSASQLKLFYKKEIIARWFAGLATSKVLILEGISGTGKTSLPYAMGKFNSDGHYIYYFGQESLRRNGVAIIVNKRF